MVEEVLKIVSSAGHAAEQARRGDAVVQALGGGREKWVASSR